MTLSKIIKLKLCQMYRLSLKLTPFCWFLDRDAYQLGTLSHVLNSRATGYQELPEWPQTPPDPSVRNVEVTMPWTDSKPLKSKKAQKKKSFYSDSESSPEGESILFVCVTKIIE